MTTDETPRLAEIAVEIADDCATDAHALDGKPFTGRAVAEQFGSTLAMLAVLARLVARLDDRVEALEREAVSA